VTQRIINHSIQAALFGALLIGNPLFAQTVQYNYDKDGRLILVTHANGTTDNYQYDVANNLIKNSGSSSTDSFAVSDFAPKSATVGSSVIITGTGFTNPAVAFNGTQATITASTDTSITVTVPTGATSGPVTITVAGQTLTAGTFTVADNPNAFTVADFAPKSAAVGNSLTIIGSGFTNPTVTINGTPATVTASTATSITVKVPTGVTSGPVVVTVGGQTQTAGIFTITAAPAFTVTEFTPKTAVVGADITITGTGFSNPIVAIAGTPATVTASTADSIIATVPDGVTNGPVTVTVGGQTLTAGVFNLLLAPELEAYSLPTAQPGDTITLSGTNFDTSSPAANIVKVNDVAAEVTAVTDTQITFVVPLMAVPINPVGTPGTEEIVTVENAAGLTTAPNPLYLVPHVAFSNPLDLAPISGTLGAYGDNGLLLVQGQDGLDRLLSVQASNVNGSGHLNVFIFSPDNTMLRKFIVPSQDFNSLLGGDFQDYFRGLTLPVNGQYVIQTVFEYDLSQAYQATGTLDFGLKTTGQTTPLHNFNDPDGKNPFAGLLQASDGNFYGTTYAGGSSSQGSIYRLTPGGELTVLHSFNGSDGLKPNDLIQASDGNFYGTTKEGGTNGKGTIFRLAANGTFVSLYSFSGPDGEGPRAGLTQANDGNLYGTAYTGGAYDKGTLFRMTLEGTLTTVHDFDFSDGANPSGRLIQAKDNALYGTTEASSTSSSGTVFRISLEGVETILYSFSSGSGYGSVNSLYSQIPVGGVVEAGDGNLYGTFSSPLGGSIFQLDPSGSLTYLHSFNNSNKYFEGKDPAGGLIQARDGNLYGTTISGGLYNFGTVFRVEPKGSFQKLHSFTGGNDGSHPFGGVVQANDGNFYGPSFDGNTNNNRAIFKLRLENYPSISTFTPASAPVGSPVVITGTNFTEATRVTFNGVLADFTVNSPTQITAIVPSDGIPITTASLPKRFNTNFGLLQNKNVSVNGFFSLGTLNATSGKFISLVGPRPKFSMKSLLAAVFVPPSVSATGFITVTTPNGSTTSLTPFTVAP
jgi:uncharacterized repeat protein (TIGR03803 family)/YD repeat-containing protein